jgi:hypothetical protein
VALTQIDSVPPSDEGTLVSQRIGPLATVGHSPIAPHDTVQYPDSTPPSLASGSLTQTC